MNRLSRNDYKAHSRMNKVCSSKRARSICGTHRGHDSQRKLTNRRNSVQHKTTQKKRRSNSALPTQSQRRSMPQKHGQVGQRKRRTTGHNGSKAEKRNDSAFELKMYLDDHYDYMQHDAEIPKEPAFHRQNTKVSDVFALRKPNFKRESRQADDIHCNPAKQQTSDDQVKCTQHGNMGITDVYPKAQVTGTRQISKKIVQDNTRNKLTDKKKTKKGFFTDVFCTFLACFGVRNDSSSKMKSENDNVIRNDLFC